MSTFDTHGNLHGNDGKFEPQHRGEGDVDDLASSATIDLSAYPEIRELGDLTPEQERLLRVLVDPDNDPWNRTTDELVADLDTNTGDNNDEIRQVADRMRADFDQKHGYGAFAVEFVTDSEGIESYYNVSTRLDDNLYLVQDGDLVDLSARDDDGIASALYTAQVLDRDFQKLRARGIEKGLIPGEPGSTERKRAWPENDAEREAYADWRYEANNGDTHEGFRDWYEGRESSRRVWESAACTCTKTDPADCPVHQPA